MRHLLNLALLSISANLCAAQTAPRGVCALPCPPGAVPEGEPDCFDGYDDTFNSGCNADPFAFASAIAPGFVVCGAGGKYTLDGSEVRDTDFYVLTLAQPATVTFSFEGEGGVWTYFLAEATDCTSLFTEFFEFVDPCTPNEQTVTIGAGEWWVFVGAFIDGNPEPVCGSRYTLGVNAPDYCAADLAPPFGSLDFSDVVAFLTAFSAMDPLADQAPPFGAYDFSDVVAFLGTFGSGCP